MFLFITLITTFLFGCQNENGNTKAEEKNTDSKEITNEKVVFDGEITNENLIFEGENTNKKLLFEGEITRVEVSEIKGNDPIIYEENDELGTFNDLFSSAIILPGIVNVGEPGFYLKLTNEDGDIERLHLWLGNENEESMLMNSQNTHIVFKLTKDMSVKLKELIGH